jgi:hypothetical protein
VRSAARPPGRSRAAPASAKLGRHRQLDVSYTIHVLSVFISYARESERHLAWVTKLADALDALPDMHVVFDQYDLHAGKDLTHFMDRGLACDRIVVVTTPTYVRKSAARSGGVGYESSVISAELLENQLSERFVPALRSGDDRPMFLKSKLYVDFRTDARFQSAVKELAKALRGLAPARRPAKIDATTVFSESSGARTLARKESRSPRLWMWAVAVVAVSATTFLTGRYLSGQNFPFVPYRPAVTCTSATQPGSGGTVIDDSSACRVPDGIITSALLHYTFDDGGEVYVNGHQVFGVAPIIGTDSGTVRLPLKIFEGESDISLKITARNAMSTVDGSGVGTVYGRASLEIHTRPKSLRDWLGL